LIELSFNNNKKVTVTEDRLSLLCITNRVNNVTIQTDLDNPKKIGVIYIIRYNRNIKGTFLRFCDISAPQTF